MEHGFFMIVMIKADKNIISESVAITISPLKHRTTEKNLQCFSVSVAIF